MKVIHTITNLQNEVSEWKRQHKTIGFVPTMGALHQGHLSLVKRCLDETDICIVSIFVNPTQFNDKKDYQVYPQKFKDDYDLLREVNCDIIFAPSEQEMYPALDTRIFDFDPLDKVMEGKFRPGHFNGVAQIVSRLFDIVKPDIAIFGLKDFQQLAVIKELVKQTNDKVKIIGSPIIREKDGLAMSSRNMLLEPEIRKNSSIIYKTIVKAASMLKNGEISDAALYVKNEINALENFEVIYFEIVDDEQLIPVKSKCEMRKDKKYFGCIAVKAGSIRLIDNIEIKDWSE